MKLDTRAKEPVKIRFKELANGNKSIYLDTIKEGKRSYEFLKMYLIPETDKMARERNKRTLEAVKVIHAERIQAIYGGKAGIPTPSTRSRVRLVDYAEEYRKRKRKNGRSESCDLQTVKMIKHLTAYKGDAVTLRDIDKSYCLGFIDYLRGLRKKDGSAFSTITLANYYTSLVVILNDAVKGGVIDSNPASSIRSEERIRSEEKEREYLTVDEVRRLIDTPCRNDMIKRSFLFSCFCGLRLSDVRGLRWGDVTQDGTQWRARVMMQKTRHELNLPLSSEAMRWVPKRDGKGDNDTVFKVPSTTHVDRMLKDWVEDAGISKRISFHCARHTFATMMLTLGTDIYTASKLLGHSNVTTTQIYAKIVDNKKDEAVNRVNGLFD